jgi:hypothetical protein
MLPVKMKRGAGCTVPIRVQKACAALPEHTSCRQHRLHGSKCGTGKTEPALPAGPHTRLREKPDSSKMVRATSRSS